MRGKLLRSPRLVSQDLELMGLENYLIDEEVVNRYLIRTFLIVFTNNHSCLPINSFG